MSRRETPPTLAAGTAALRLYARPSVSQTHFGIIIRLSSLPRSWRKRKFILFLVMANTATPEIMPDIERDEKSKPESEKEPGYLVICWNDPVNLMTYVTHVFQAVFAWQKQKAEFHMLQVHNLGKSVLVRESLEKAEHYVHQLQKYSLHATMERDE